MVGEKLDDLFTIIHLDLLKVLGKKSKNILPSGGPGLMVMNPMIESKKNTKKTNPRRNFCDTQQFQGFTKVLSTVNW